MTCESCSCNERIAALGRSVESLLGRLDRSEAKLNALVGSLSDDGK